MIWIEWFPVREKAVAIARPMPREPPVIRTRIGRGGAVEWNDLMVLLDGRADFEGKERSDPGACILYIVPIILNIWNWDEGNWKEEERLNEVEAWTTDVVVSPA